MSKKSDGSRSARTGRFQKGHSGNPKGRPHGKTTPADAMRSAFEILWDKQVTVTQGGVDRELSVQEALERRILDDAFAGKPAAERTILKMIIERDKAIADSTQRTVPLVIVKDEPTEPRNADVAMCLLGTASPDESLQEHSPGALLLESWAAQAALSRRRGTEVLTSEEILHIEHCTRAPKTLHWPRGTKE